MTDTIDGIEIMREVMGPVRRERSDSEVNAFATFKELPESPRAMSAKTVNVRIGANTGVA